jgi:hypothetical protein
MLPKQNSPVVVGSGIPRPPIRVGSARSGRELGNLLDRCLEEGRQEDSRNRGLQGGKGRRNVRRHALEVLPLRLE